MNYERKRSFPSKTFEEDGSLEILVSIGIFLMIGYFVYLAIAD